MPFGMIFHTLILEAISSGPHFRDPGTLKLLQVHNTGAVVLAGAG